MANTVAVVADTKTGKTYKIEVPQESLNALTGRKIGDEVDGIFLNLPGYKLTITGGSSVDGFPMKKDLPIQGKKRILVKYSSGKRGKRGLRKRVTFRGSIVGPDITQLNMKITQYGPSPIGQGTEEKKE
ncbi:30S ribosomal protein S6e [Thermogymnomonas acidicola]|uniref:Small ribosomal subunit protein eS6 n=1 Tax=Thermogymnomonas acidicola TaxID=399579 RepID=A0AA37BRG4_9ARCH|nr:30S ribosomal protein S6e [Thermogymnomonas acidicola]GGM70934.1 30S ribosomal protein S6e [Thermogymnomonas acidicola]